MVSKEQLLSYSSKFDLQLLLKMIPYKKSIQEGVLSLTTHQEEMDIAMSRINTNVITKLCKVAAPFYRESPTMETLYCLSMSVGTIIKEYEWGLKYISGDGLYEIAQMIDNNK